MKKQAKRSKSKKYTPAQVKKHIDSGILQEKKDHVIEKIKKPEPVREPIVEIDAKLIKRSIKA